jgi:hypothetical protein
MTIDDVSKPWYREFWAWFIFSPLIVVVLVSSVTVTIAVRNADDRVIDNYYKEGRMINMRIEEDLLAQSLQVQATLVFDQRLHELSAELSLPRGDLPETLTLELSHPVRADFDQVITLVRVAANQYHAELPSLPASHRWYLRVLPAKENPASPLWRLRGEIDFATGPSVLLKASG